MVIADCTGTACTNITRGISSITGTSTVTALKKAHRRGASVKITDGPFLVQLSNIVRGSQNIVGLLRYESTAAGCTNPTDICAKTYVDATANAGAATSTESNGGIVELGTQLEMASSTDNGATQPTVVQSKYGTSTPSGTSYSGLYFPVTKNNGKLSQLFLDLTESFTFSGGLLNTASSTFTATTTILANSTTTRPLIL